MQKNMTLIKDQLWLSFADKEYRDSFVSSNISTAIASQVFSLRESRKWTQQDLAEKSGMAQNRISVLENLEEDNLKIGTLKRIASAFDIALTVRFESFSGLLDWVVSQDSEKLVPVEYSKDQCKAKSDSSMRPIPDFAIIVSQPLPNSTYLLIGGQHA